MEEIAKEMAKDPTPPTEDETQWNQQKNY
jgi:hypothetical protein